MASNRSVDVSILSSSQSTATTRSVGNVLCPVQLTRLTIVNAVVTSGPPTRCGNAPDEHEHEHEQLYSLVARGKTVLAEFTFTTGNFPTITRVLLGKIPPEDTKMSYVYDQ